MYDQVSNRNYKEEKLSDLTPVIILACLIALHAPDIHCIYIVELLLHMYWCETT